MPLTSKAEDEALAASLLKAALKGDPYPAVAIPAGVGPGVRKWEPFDAGGKWQRPLERNIVVGPLLVSSCQCPHCGELFAHCVPLANGVSPFGGLLPDEPDPPCLRCELKLGMPLNADEVEAMVELRWRWDQFRYAMREGGPTDQKGQKEALVRLCGAERLHALTLLKGMEWRYGNQVNAGVAAIEGGARGVTETAEEPSAGRPTGATS